MTRVWSMASERTDSEDCAQRQQIEDAIIYVCNGAGRQLAPPPPTMATTTPPLGQPLPPDNDSGYEASPSSATRLASFQFGGLTDSAVDSTLDEELLSIDLFFAPIMLYDNDVLDNNSDDETQQSDDHNPDLTVETMRAESRNSGGSTGSNGSDRLISTPIPIPMTSRNSLTQTSHLTERSRMSSPLSLSHTNMSFGTNSNRFVSDCDERGFGGEMFGRHHRHRYHMGMNAISPQSPPSSTYWSPYIMGMVSPVGRGSHHNNHNHYGALNESMTSAQTAFNYSQDIRLPSPLSSVSLISQMSGRVTTNSINESFEERNNNNNDNNNIQPLPDVVNVEVRMRSSNGHNQARRAVSVSLPIDAETIRSVGVSLRRISEDFEISTSRMMLSNSEPASHGNGVVGNMLASIRLSRRSLSSRFRSHYIQLNGRPRSFSTNDAKQE